MKCNCERRNIQVFYCDVETCKDHAQKFFCYDCVVYGRKHDHDRISIKDELEKRSVEWKTLTEAFDALCKIIEDNYYQFQYLIKYLDNENLLKTDLTVKNPVHNVD